jgi:hypothetical protein
MSLISYVKTVMNKRLLISESHDDSNRCTSCKKKFDQHATCFTRSVRVCLSTIRISRGSRIAIFHESSTGLDGCTASKKKCSRLHLSIRLSGPWDPSHFLSQHNHWSSAHHWSIVLKPSTYWRQTTRLTRLISPACDWYVQYVLMGINPSVLNRHRQGLQSWRYQLATSHFPTFPINDLHFLPKSPARSQVINQIITTWI